MLHSTLALPWQLAPLSLEMPARSLIVTDDDSRVVASLTRALEDDSTCVLSASSAEEALGIMARHRPDILLTDLRMPGMDGLALLRIVRERLPATDVILMTAYDELELVALAMREGAADFLVKPLDLHQLRRTIAKVYEDRAARSNAASSPSTTTPRRTLIGRDPRMVDILKTVGRISASRTNVVIRGESGTGKELIARAIHDGSPYAAEPFVAVNCTALPSTLLESELFGHVRGAFTGASSDRRGRFAQAGRGTVFLDEIGDTLPEFQAKLLRVLQEREFHPVGADRAERTDARIIAATHRNLEKLIRTGDFREDLYYRLRVVEIAIPPLRERIADVPQLAERLIAGAAAAHGRRVPRLSKDALDALMSHNWPGNVRELENCLVRAVILAGDVIHGRDLAIGEMPTDAKTTISPTTLDQVEREHVQRVLEGTRGRKSAAARLLGISRPRLDRLIRKYGLDAGQLGE